MEIARQAPEPAGAGPLARWACRLRAHWSTGLRWLSITALLFALAVPVLVFQLHSPVPVAAHLVFCIILSGVTSVVMAAMARWFSGMTRSESVQSRFGMLILLSVLVIAVNVMLLARLLFVSSQDVQLLLTFVAFGVAVTLVIASPIAGRISRAVGQLELGAGRIAAGEYSYRIAEDGSSEAEELAHLATSIQAMVEAIADGVVSDPVTVQHYHQCLQAEVRCLSARVEELFELTRLESGALMLDRERMDIEDVIADAVEALRERAEQAHIHLTCQMDSLLPPVFIDAAKICCALTRLLENAVRFTLPGGIILIRCSLLPRADRKEDILVQVIDTGEGIAAHDLAHVFEPTYRGERSRKRRQTAIGGARADCEVGLGLSITAYLVEAHGGRIWATSPLPPAARTLVALPGGQPQASNSTPGTVVSFTLPAAGL
jgi:signal transduction histidine kinase